MKNLIVAILLLSVVMLGCKNVDQTLGLNLLPDVKILKTIFLQDKSPISTSIVTDAKIRVDHPAYNLLGSFNDPLFGRTDASFAAQFRILLNHPNYKASASLDSIVLYMSYKKIYGDTVSSQTIKVFELANSINYETKYLSSRNIKDYASNEPIGSSSFIPKFRTDSLQRDTTLQIIRVRLNSAFGNRLLRIDSLEMTSNDKLLNVFKGLYISTSSLSRKGTLISIFNTKLTTESVDTRPSIILYYHDPVLKRDTLGFAYRVTENSANVASYVHDYTLARFKPNIDKANNLDSLIYIQPTGGIKSKVIVPSLSAWQHKDSANYAINKATLTFHVDTIMSDYRRYAMPSRLYLMAIDSTGTEVFPADSQLSSSYYGGFYNSVTATYSFNVTQHLQQLIAGTIKNQGFYLVPSDRNSSAQRVVLKGLGSAKPVQLNVTYTKYK